MALRPGSGLCRERISLKQSSTAEKGAPIQLFIKPCNQNALNGRRDGHEETTIAVALADAGKSVSQPWPPVRANDQAARSVRSPVRGATRRARQARTCAVSNDANGTNDANDGNASGTTPA